MFSPPISLILKKDYTNNLMRRLKALQKLSVQWGWFGGEHYSGMTYAGLAYMHAQGVPENRIRPRPVLNIAFNFNPISKAPLKKDLRKYLSNIKVKNAPIKVEKIGENLGKYYRDQTWQTFGPGALRKNSDTTVALKELDGVIGQNPLIHHGDLQAEISYRLNGGPPMKHG